MNFKDVVVIVAEENRDRLSRPVARGPAEVADIAAAKAALEVAVRDAMGRAFWVDTGSVPFGWLTEDIARMDVIGETGAVLSAEEDFNPFTEDIKPLGYDPDKVEF